MQSRNYNQYLQNLYALDKLEKIPKIPGKKFVYAHLFDTHQPFTYTANGGFREIFRDSDAAYRDQIIYTNQRLLQILRTILRDSPVPPIIILQGDHSFAYKMEDRPKILNAYYLPDGGAQKLTPQTSPVNTFRLVFNTYFQGSYPYLPNVSHYLDDTTPIGDNIIPDTCVSAGK
jgi:hypothetical protein